MPEDDKKQAALSWSLWRIDDNGNKFLVKTFPDKSEAEKLLRDFESKGHK
ncbi:MAG: hypothetical protein AB1393_13050 [Candidatus Edwardsbacteria bacterium]